jgi:hypothetical protein|tara:strand:+ start:186 stop:323 length:138 start_codon:yes stop_codon:yes gene_type:complete
MSNRSTRIKILLMATLMAFHPIKVFGQTLDKLPANKKQEIQQRYD